MQRVYLDNAATSFPKPEQMRHAVSDYFEMVGVNVGRGGYATAYTAAGMVLHTREQLCALFGFTHPRNVIFTSGVTMSLNMLLKGLLKPGDHLLTSSMEHNAVMRPLGQLAALGVEVEPILCTPQGELNPDEVAARIRPNTRAVVMTHASNVCGTILPVAQVGAICRTHGVFFIVDCAQTAGTEPIDMEAMAIDALAFTGHKGLLGPQGIGGFLVADRLARELTPLIAGGTGSFSHMQEMPEILPDRFEAGTMNLPGIYGLSASLDYLSAQGLESIRLRERDMAQRLTSGLEQYAGARVVGVRDPLQKTGVVSVDITHADNAQIAFSLDSEYGIMTRVGLHCAPDAHKTIGTYPQGTVRFSVGAWTTPDEIDFTIDTVGRILQHSN